MKLSAGERRTYQNGTQLDGKEFEVIRVWTYPDGEDVYEVILGDGIYYMSQVVVDDYHSKGQLSDEIRECKV